MHQKKDWKTYSPFGNCLVTEKPKISALLACGTNGEKATFFRCFIHFKKNIEEHLENRGFDKKLKKSFLHEIFGVQNSDKTLCGLMDCSFEEEFDQKLSALESVWNAREDNVSAKVNTLEV